MKDYFVGDAVITTKQHETINEGTEVVVVGKDRFGGYDIEDDEGNRVHIGWEI